MTITQFIQIVSPKLKSNKNISYEYYKGADLKLTGHKTANGGKSIEDHKMYKVPVPVETKTDHARKMKLAWLRGGKSAVRNYLSNYIDKKTLDKIMTIL